VAKKPAKTASKKQARPSAPAQGGSASPAKKPAGGGKAAAKATPKAAQKAGDKGKPQTQAAKAKKAPAAAKAKASKPASPAKQAKAEKPSTGTKPAAPTKSQGKAASRRSKTAQPAALDPGGRPASKPHVHPAGEEPQALPGRPRKDSAGPTHNGVGDAAVRKATGQGWNEWFKILDDAGASLMEHAAIATLLGETHSVPEWWSQTITVGYEQARGLRRKNEATDGFQAGVSKTINAATAKLYRAWEDEATRTRWMGDHKVEIRVANTDKNIRMTWLVQGPDEGSSVEVYFWPKDANKCLVQVQQRKLADAEAVQRVRAFWSVKLENLRAAMEKA
jgi:uncharacterized protein YndB with AHSA1/START domain